MTTKIDIIFHDVELEIEIETTPPEPENGIEGGFEIIAVNVLEQHDIWPFLREYRNIEEDLLEAIEKKGREE